MRLGLTAAYLNYIVSKKEFVKFREHTKLKSLDALERLLDTFRSHLSYL